MDISEQFKEIRQRHERRSQDAYNYVGLAWLEKMFLDNYGVELPTLYVYETLDDNRIQVEWTIGKWEVTLEVGLNDKRGEYQALHIESEKQIDKEFDLALLDSWKTINEITAELVKEARASITEKRKKNRELLEEYREKLEEELYEYCEANGGHDWTSWEPKGEMWVAGWTTWKQRVCMICHKEETKDYVYPGGREDYDLLA
jgi:hypothetical protein